MDQDFSARLRLATAISRREWFQRGAAVGLGLSFGGLLRAQIAAAESAGAAAALPAGIKSCIVLFYYGGPSHFETYDMKPDAPAEVRGEFKPISTSVPGLQICEHLPQMARVMHHVALVRGMHHKNRLHDSASTEVLTGRPSPNGDREEFTPIPQFFPCFGATLSHARRANPVEIPHAALPFVFQNVHPVPCQGGGFLGTAYDPLQIAVDPDAPNYRVGALALPEGETLDKLAQRRDFLAQLNTGPADPGRDRALGQLNQFYNKAFDLLGSTSLTKALDLSQEDQKTRERYGLGSPPATSGGNGAEMGFARQSRGQHLLVARRLVEAGVPFINVYDFKQQGQNWDAHAQCAAQHKDYLLPQADQSLSALIEDLEVRGLLDSTLVVAMGEFGRTPQINKQAGRDHWPDCYTVLLAGGGVKGGYAHGASDRLGAYPLSDPTTPADLAATIFWRFGLNPAAEIQDHAGRPYKVADGAPIRELFA